MAEKTLIFSDTHLTDRFDQGKFDLLSSLIKDVDRVVINGDFVEGFAVSASEFINSPWQGLFPLLQEKETIYLWGNHDLPEISKPIAPQFSRFFEQVFEIKVGEEKLKIEHGNRIIKGHNESFLGNFIPRSKLVGFSILLHIDGGPRVFGRKFNTRFAKHNQVIKNYQQKTGDCEMLVTGHTHFSEDARSERYINCGCWCGGYADYLLIEDKKINLMQARY